MKYQKKSIRNPVEIKTNWKLSLNSRGIQFNIKLEMRNWKLDIKLEMK